eukprot:scaffold28063_cov52-Attheya_sp.AAC.3
MMTSPHASLSFRFHQRAQLQFSSTRIDNLKHFACSVAFIEELFAEQAYPCFEALGFSGRILFRMWLQRRVVQHRERG